MYVCLNEVDSKGPVFVVSMAEKEGFEPSGHCCPAVFKTAALNHSTISPSFNMRLKTGVFKRALVYFFALTPDSRPRRSRFVTSFTKAAGSGSGLPSVSSDWSNSTFA